MTLTVSLSFRRKSLLVAMTVIVYSPGDIDWRGLTMISTTGYRGLTACLLRCTLSLASASKSNPTAPEKSSPGFSRMEKMPPPAG